MSMTASRGATGIIGRVREYRVATDRFEVIARYIQRGSVLDVGCVDSRPQKEETGSRLERKSESLLVDRIVAVNPNTVCLDIDESGIDRLRDRGYQAVCADATDVDLGEEFSTIVAGELIEHLENPGLFLRNMHRHLQPGGVLLLSTPNPFSIARFWKIVRRGMPPVHEDHTCWFDPVTLEQLLERCGLEPIAGYWIQPAKKRLRNWPYLLRRFFCHHFLVVARKPRDEPSRTPGDTESSDPLRLYRNGSKP